MGGQLSLVSTPGAGSTFSVDLSLQLADASAQARAQPADLSGLRILIADDNAAARRLIARAMDQWGAHAEDVGTLPELLRELRATAYNAVVIDDSLLDGAMTAELQRVFAERAARPRVIRLVSFVNLAQTQGSDMPWFDAEITKPVRLTQLQRALTGDTATDSTPAGGQPAPTPMLAIRARVLVVEDQSLNRDVAEGMLKSLGLDVDTANDGSHALEMLARGSYDVVLMDCRMPVMDGFTATTELRRREGAGRRVPVIALTADTTNLAREACFNAGMDDYLGKPFSRATLRAALERWLPAQATAPPATNREAADSQR
jgi:CheY-like chemotaxis protein